MKLKRVVSVFLAFAMVMTMCAIPNGSVEAATTAKKITLNHKNATIEAGKTTKLKVKVTPAKAKKTITWQSSNKKIAKVNKKGVVTGVKAGKATITVRVKSGKKLLKAKCKVTVKKVSVTPSAVKVSAVTGDKTSTTLDESEIEQFKVSVQPSNATNKVLKFYSMDENVATVSNTGVITAVAQGTTTITAVSTDGTNKSASIKVTVTKKNRPRTIITQDAEVDDKDSLVHALLYANEIDIQGIIQSSSQHHWKGVAGKTNPGVDVNNKTNDWGSEYRWPGTDWMFDYLDDYATVYPNLKKQDSSYPTPDYLRSVTMVGNIGYEGEMDSATDGSELIKKTILDNDDRTLYLMAWGGCNTIARALSDIEDEYKNTAQWETLRQKIEKKIVISAWGTQDTTYINYIAEVYPQVKYVDVSSTIYGYMWSNSLSGETAEKFMAPFMRKYIDYNHGALMDNYVTWGDGTYLEGEGASDQFGLDELVGTKNWWGGNWSKRVYQRYDFLSEGDSPSFFMLFDTGLRNLENEAFGGYHGRYALDTTKQNKSGVQLNYWKEQNDNSMTTTGATEKSDIKWLIDVQNEFATRAAWCTANTFEKANHEPAISVDKGVDIEAAAGEPIRLKATTSDPDGDYVNVSWSEYKDAETYTGEPIELKGADSDIVNFTVPADAAPGQTIHIIAKASDDVTNSLSHYQRVIITVK